MLSSTPGHHGRRVAVDTKNYKTFYKEEFCTTSTQSEVGR